jgi:hypothetical protein
VRPPASIVGQLVVAAPLGQLPLIGHGIGKRRPDFFVLHFRRQLRNDLLHLCPFERNYRPIGRFNDILLPRHLILVHQLSAHLAFGAEDIDIRPGR